METRVGKRVEKWWIGLRKGGGGEGMLLLIDPGSGRRPFIFACLEIHPLFGMILIG